MLNRYSFVKQFDEKDCGAACLATIAKHYGKRLSITKIREMAGTDNRGTNVFGLVSAANAIDMRARAVRGSQDDFYTDFPLPCIANVAVPNLGMHFIVIHKITKDYVLVADPAKGIEKWSNEDFFSKWTGVLILFVPESTFEKTNEKKGLFERFFHLLLPQKKLLMSIFFASILFTLLGIAGAFYYKFLIDDVLRHSLSKTLHMLSIGAIVLVAFKVILQLFRSYLLLHLSQRLDIELLLGYYSHVIRLPMHFFGTRKVGEIVSRFQDASKVREAISSTTLTLMIDSLMVIAGGAILYFQNSYMFGMTLVVAFCYLIVVVSFNKIFRKLNREQMEDNAQLTSYLVESLNGILTVKSSNGESLVNNETEKRFFKFLESIFRLGMTTNIQATLQALLDGAGGIAILWLGASQVLKGNITLGQLIAFNSLLAYFLGPIKNIINLQPMLQTAVVASERLGEILDLEIEKTDLEDSKINPESLRGDIEFKNVDFRYGKRKLILKNLSFKIAQGEKVAIVGESGSGKTTLAKLILNLYPPEEGEILINGDNIQDIRYDALRSKTSYVTQDTFLFSGTVLENLKFGLNNVKLNDIVEAARMAKAHEFINDLPLRYNTYLEENGTNLSGGQRQRLSIARAILKKPDILILDEATSNLDSITEKAIEKTIEECTKGASTIIIAHRLSTIKKCDKIIVLEKGEIIEIGSHRTLINKRGRYYDMWKEQGIDDERFLPASLEECVS